MSLTSRLKRLGRLAIAPIKGFFTWGPNPRPRYPENLNFWAYTKEVLRQDFREMFEPFTNAVKEFKREKARPY